MIATQAVAQIAEQTELSPYDQVLAHYKFTCPPERRALQMGEINRLAPLPRSGWWDEVGTGKTLMTAFVALYKQLHEGGHTVVVMPPVLITQWYRWLCNIENVTKIMYRGTPKERAKLNIHKDFVLMSLPIFKRDYERIYAEFDGKVVRMIVDEADSIKNVGSGNYQAVRDFCEGRTLLPATGTPLSNPGDAYAYIKLISPLVYRNQGHFESLHVGERDFFDNVVKWTNLDYLSDNLMLNSSRILAKEANPDLTDPIYIPVHYELDAAHKRLYKTLMDQQLLTLPNGGKIDATTAAKLHHCSQQIICNPGHFSGDPNMRSAAHELLDAVLNELKVGNVEGGHKLIIFANYTMTNRGLAQYLRPYNAVACYSEVGDKKKEANIERFKHDPTCRILHGHPDSMGKGTDGLQHVCWDTLYLETPLIVRHFTQGVGRTVRDGQQHVPRVRIAIAEGTIQPRLHARLLQKDQLINQVAGGYQDLRDAIYGKE